MPFLTLLLWTAASFSLDLCIDGLEIKPQTEFTIGIISSELSEILQEPMGSAMSDERGFSYNLVSKSQSRHGDRFLSAVQFAIRTFQNATRISGNEIVISNKESTVTLKHIVLRRRCDAGELLTSVSGSKEHFDAYVIGEYLDECLPEEDEVTSNRKRYNLFCNAIDIISTMWDTPCVSWSCIPNIDSPDAQEVRKNPLSFHVKFFPNSDPTVQTVIAALHHFGWLNIGLLSVVDVEPWNTFCGKIKDELLLNPDFTLRYYDTVFIDGKRKNNLLINKDLLKIMFENIEKSHSKAIVICAPTKIMRTGVELIEIFTSSVEEKSKKAYLWVDPIGRFSDEKLIHHITEIRKNETLFLERQKQEKMRAKRALAGYMRHWNGVMNTAFGNKWRYPIEDWVGDQKFVSEPAHNQSHIARRVPRSEEDMNEEPTVVPEKKDNAIKITHRILSFNVLLLSPALEYILKPYTELASEHQDEETKLSKLGQPGLSVYFADALVILIKTLQRQATVEFDIKSISQEQILHNVREMKSEEMPMFSETKLLDAPSYYLYNYLKIENIDTLQSSWETVPMLDIYLSKDGREFNLEEKVSGGLIWSKHGRPVPDGECDSDDLFCHVRSTNLRMVDFFIALLGITVAYILAYGLWRLKRRGSSSLDSRGSAKIFLSQEDLRLICPPSDKSKTFGGGPMMDYTSNNSRMQSSVSLVEQTAPIGEDDNVLGSLDGEIVFIKRVKSGQQANWKTTKEILQTLSQMRQENLVYTYGVYCGSLLQGLVMEYCSRGSLRQLIMNREYALDSTFKLSLIHDIVKGMKYIHGSSLKSHGRLKSTNCMVDSRFVLKITDYGYNNVCNSLVRNEQKQDTPNDLLWTAPELLKDENQRKSGTQKGDSYSFAIICQEIFLRTVPYAASNMSGAELIEKVKNGDQIARPILTEEAAPVEMVRVVNQCWEEQPESRLAFSVINSELKKLRKGKKHNIVENMMKQLEEYSSNLEDLVVERTTELDEEKKKTESLLMRMLPRSVAKMLMADECVVPETFEKCTIYFSDICGFTTISLASTPMQVVDLLNDLYTCFDAIIEKYEVYKVETIGDAYMVSSGIPKRIDDRHASEIAVMSLDILSATSTFKIRHLPDTILRIRIGLHSGKAVAGVVGLTMPRYCLFGDTINTASRLESSGIPSRIHVSEPTRDLLVQSNMGFKLEERGSIELKGRGMMKTWWLTGMDGWTKSMPPPGDVNAASHGIDIGEIKKDSAAPEIVANKTEPGTSKASDPKSSTTPGKAAAPTTDSQKTPPADKTKTSPANKTNSNNNNNNLVLYPMQQRRVVFSATKLKCLRGRKITDANPV